MMKVAIILLAAFVGYSSALSCIKCEYGYAGGSKECLENPTKNLGNCSIGVACFKHLYNGGATVKRGCASFCDGGSEISCCRTDYCNSSDVISMTGSLLFLALLLAAVFNM